MIKNHRICESTVTQLNIAFSETIFSGKNILIAIRKSNERKRKKIETIDRGCDTRLGNQRLIATFMVA